MYIFVAWIFTTKNKTKERLEKNAFIKIGCVSVYDDFFSIYLFYSLFCTSTLTKQYNILFGSLLSASHHTCTQNFRGAEKSSSSKETFSKNIMGRGGGGIFSGCSHIFSFSYSSICYYTRTSKLVWQNEKLTWNTFIITSVIYIMYTFGFFWRGGQRRRTNRLDHLATYSALIVAEEDPRYTH